MTYVPDRLLAYRPLIILPWVTVLCQFLLLQLILPSALYRLSALIISGFFVKEILSWGSQVNEHVDNETKSKVSILVVIYIAEVCIGVLMTLGLVSSSINTALFFTALGIAVNGYRDYVLSGSPFSVSGLSANYMATSLVSYGLLFWAIARAVARY